MYLKITTLVGMLTLLSPVGFGQSMNASITGGGGSNGKCTIEVEVEQGADVSIRGTRATIRASRGQRANFRRFQCNQPMPLNPANFRFRGIDGRGRQTLISDPGRNGEAIVRIEDNRGGREGYTFDIEWNGQNGPGVGGGYPPPGPGFGRPPGGNRWTTAQAVNGCRNEVLHRMQRDGVRNPKITSANLDSNPGRRDYVTGFASGRRGEDYRFECSVDFDSGRVRNVSIQRR
ncbi:hypothetical protein [Bryobacter aggregatus]|uniref:hypothetical protein n=1 Tax=Bryobacter aggregatus TaxID=360054 RepID=UPI000566780A|nr:hypothetical protein [Bryobacter aggregatus]